MITEEADFIIGLSNAEIEILHGLIKTYGKQHIPNLENLPLKVQKAVDYANNLDDEAFNRFKLILEGAYYAVINNSKRSFSQNHNYIIGSQTVNFVNTLSNNQNTTNLSFEPNFLLKLVELGLIREEQMLVVVEAVAIYLKSNFQRRSSHDN